MNKTNTQLILVVGFIGFLQQTWTDKPKRAIDVQEGGIYNFDGDYVIAPNATPHAPIIKIVNATTTSLTVQLIPHEVDRKTVDSYTVFHRKSFGNWQEDVLRDRVDFYTIERLKCGTQYQIYARAHNKLGSGEKSNVLDVRTLGKTIVVPDDDKFLEISSRHAVLNFGGWSEGDCQKLRFTVEKQKEPDTNWYQVESNIPTGTKYNLFGLEPGQRYNLRIKGDDDSGSVTVHYEFLTLNDTSDSHTQKSKREIPDEPENSQSTTHEIESRFGRVKKHWLNPSRYRFHTPGHRHFGNHGDPLGSLLFHHRPGHWRYYHTVKFGNHGPWDGHGNEEDFYDEPLNNKQPWNQWVDKNQWEDENEDQGVYQEESTISVTTEDKPEVVTKPVYEFHIDDIPNPWNGTGTVTGSTSSGNSQDSNSSGTATDGETEVTTEEILITTTTEQVPKIDIRFPEI